MRELEDNFAHKGDRGQTGKEVGEHDRKKKKYSLGRQTREQKEVVDDKGFRHDSTGAETRSAWPD